MECLLVVSGVHIIINYLAPDDQIQQNTCDLYAIFILDIVMKKRMK